MEGRRNQESIDLEEAKAIFRVASETRDVKKWKRAAEAAKEINGRQFNHKAVKKPFRTAVFLLRSDIQKGTINQETSEKIIQDVGYSISEVEFKKYADWFFNWLQAGNQQVHVPEGGAGRTHPILQRTWIIAGAVALLAVSGAIATTAIRRHAAQSLAVAPQNKEPASSPENAAQSCKSNPGTWRGSDLCIGDRVAVTAGGKGLKTFTTLPHSIPQQEGPVIPVGYEGTLVDGPYPVDGRAWWLVQWVTKTKTVAWSAETSPDGGAGIQPLPGYGLWPNVSHLSSSFLVQVYRDAGSSGLPVRQEAGEDRQLLSRRPIGAQGWTMGRPFRDGDFIWWKVDWGDGLQGWSEDSVTGQGVFLARREMVGEKKAVLLLYVRELSKDDPVVTNAQVTVRDAGGEIVELMTNAYGFVMVTGTPGPWYFTISAPGFKERSWADNIVSGPPKHAFFAERSP